MNYSAQTIVISIQGDIYLEDNHVIKALSFFGGKVEESEDYEMAALREIKEELGLSIGRERLLGGELQPVRTFWNEKIQSFLERQSKYFILILKEQEKQFIETAIHVKKFSLYELENTPDERFPFGCKNICLEKIEKALSYISLNNNYYENPSIES